uniref:WSF1 n=1 Tax=Onchidium reevesii TaxID=2547651 RepID=A0A5P8PF21_9EUPU|nr:WSF1 [Onchidium reevesii]
MLYSLLNVLYCICWKLTIGVKAKEFKMANEPEASKIAEAVESDDTIASWITEANDGSETHQYQLGSHYLKLAESGIDREENAAKAVSWLIAASKRGHEEATAKLRHCVSTDTGITDANKSEVTWCLNTTASEKKIRTAAKSLFTKISGSQGGALSTHEYVEAVKALTAGHEKEQKLLLAAGRKIGSTITENDFVKTMSKKIQGTLTLTSDEMDETTAAYASAGILQKIFVYPKQTGSIIVDQVLEYASKEGLNAALSLIPTNQIYLLALLFLYSYLTPGFLFLVIPLMVFYISALVLLIATLQMFYKKRKQKDATTLTKMLQQQFDMDIDMESTESQYTWNSLTPYLVYFTGLPIMILSLSLANKNYIPCAEFLVVSLVMTGFSFVGLSDSHDHLTLLAIASHAFASLPIFLSKMPNIPVVSKLLAVLTRPIYSLELGLGVAFNVSIPSVVYMLIPLLLFRMAMRGSWSGIYKALIPHLVCFFWFNISTTVFPFTTWTGIARATFGYMLLPVLVPLSLFIAFFGMIYLIYQLMQTEMVGKLFVTAILFAVPILLTQTKTFVKKGGKESPKAQKIKKIVMITFSVLGILPLLFVRIPSLMEKKSLSLSWDDYKELCIPSEGLVAPFQLRCRDFLGTKVQWKGFVEQVKITKVENTADSVIKTLPSILSEPLSCIYGERIGECDPKTMSKRALKHCQLVRDTGRTCHLGSHNQLTFSLTVKVEDTVLNLEAGSSFQSRLMALLPGDELEFSGTLADVGTASPSLKLKSVTCVSRELPLIADIEEDLDEDMFFKMVNEAIALTFNFGLFPILSYSAQ